MAHSDDLYIDVLLFDGFEPLDVYGPVEMFGQLGKVAEANVGVTIRFLSQRGGSVHGSYNVDVPTVAMNTVETADILLVPGGQGTRSLVDDAAFIQALKTRANATVQCLTVCTGSALLGKTGLLNGRRATTNKIAFDWVKSVAPAVNWIEKARWVSDGKYVTSSGISAGMDMTLGFLSTSYGNAIADEVARRCEYVRNPDSASDPFARG